MIAIPIAALAIGAAMSYQQAEQKNKALKKAQKSATQAANIQSKQLTARTDVESQKTIRQSRAIRANALVAAADSGFDTGSSDVESLLRAIDADTELNLDILDDNDTNNQDLLRSQLGAQIDSYKSQSSNGLMSAFSGLLGGAQSGFSLTSGIQGYQNASDARNDLTAKQAAANTVP